MARIATSWNEISPGDIITLIRKDTSGVEITMSGLSDTLIDSAGTPGSLILCPFDILNEFIFCF